MEKENDNLSAGRFINELARASQIYFQHEFTKHQVGPAQIRTLLYIAHNEGRTQNELAKYLNLDKSSITSQLQILEKNGYIKRQTAEQDARKQVIAITVKTARILPAIKHVLSSWTETLLHGFTESERVAVFNYLQKMKENAQSKLSQIQKDKEV